jgi:AraC-like DNA-binding protein
VTDGLHVAWIDRLIHEVQELSLAVITAERDDLPRVVHAFSARLTDAPDPLHNALLANALLDVCRHIFESLHAALSYERCTCAAETWPLMMRFTRWYETDPRVAVCGWADAFVEVYRRSHPPTCGTRAAELIRRDSARRWNVTLVARDLGVNRRKLSDDFKAHFAIGLPDYVHLARVARALGALEAPVKIEALSRESGFRSKKDFYRAFRQWTGLKPAAARALAPEDRRMLQASLTARCLWGDRFAASGDARARAATLVRVPPGLRKAG